MKRAKSLVYLSLAISISLGAAAAAQAQTKLSADEIVSKSVAAAGGVQAWRNLQTLSMSGKMQAGGNNRPPVAAFLPHHGARPPVEEPKPSAAQVELPFRMDLKRGRKQRIELDFNGQTAVQIYDGVNGWMKRPYLNRTDYEPYNAEQTKAAASVSDLDGPLVDYAAKGTAIHLAGTEKVDGRDNYKLKLTLKNGYSFHVWIDAQTFLETKMEGSPRRLDGEMRPVEIYMKDYQTVNGLKIPFVLETRVSFLPAHAKEPQIITETISVEKAELNPKFDDSMFVKPKSEVASNTSNKPTVRP